MPSELQRVAQALLDALDEVPRIVLYLHDRAGKYREAAGWVGSLSSNPQAQQAAMQLDEAARRCEEAAHYLSLAPPKARGWVEQMVSGARTAEPRGSSRGPRPDAAAGRTPPAEGRREPAARKSGETAGGTKPKESPEPLDDQPDTFEPTVSDILERLPVRKSGDKTRGVWIDGEGRERDLVSGIDDDSTDVKRFMQEHGIKIAPGPDTLGSHVEIKFAMRMRRQGLTDETITINNKPCPGPYGCHRNLWRFLPEGARLTVYGPDGFKRTYPE